MVPLRWSQRFFGAGLQVPTGGRVRPAGPAEPASACRCAGSADPVRIRSRRSQSGWEKGVSMGSQALEAGIRAFREGRGVVLVDDPDRENEGDIIIPAERITEKLMAMMIRDCSGIVCLCLGPGDGPAAELPPMVARTPTTTGPPSRLHRGQGGHHHGGLGPRPGGHHPRRHQARGGALGPGPAGAVCPPGGPPGRPAGPPGAHGRVCGPGPHGRLPARGGAVRAHESRRHQ